MKITSALIIIFSPLILGAQRQRLQSEPVVPYEQQLKVGKHTVIIQPIDFENKTQKWISLENGDSVMSIKKLVTPYGKHIIRQDYLEGANSVIRIDQYATAGRFSISAYVFDVRGYVVYQKDLLDTPLIGKKVLPQPYAVLQSPDKHTLSLVQSIIIGGERLNISGINLNAELVVTSNLHQSFPFDPKQVDMYMPMVTNDGYLLVLIADKFESYRIGSTLTCHLLDGINEKVKRTDFNFERKKVKGLQFELAGDTLRFSASFGESANKKVMMGALNGGMKISTQTKFPLKEYLYENRVNR